jgi:hypothetical protein
MTRFSRNATVKSMIDKILKWLSAENSRDLDRYLSQASNAADVDRLLRKWEGQQRHNTYHLV